MSAWPPTRPSSGQKLQLEGHNVSQDGLPVRLLGSPVSLVVTERGIRLPASPGKLTDTVLGCEQALTYRLQSTATQASMAADSSFSFPSPDWRRLVPKAQWRRPSPFPKPRSPSGLSSLSLRSSPKATPRRHGNETISSTVERSSSPPSKPHARSPDEIKSNIYGRTGSTFSLTSPHESSPLSPSSTSQPQSPRGRATSHCHCSPAPRPIPVNIVDKMYYSRPVNPDPRIPDPQTIEGLHDPKPAMKWMTCYSFWLKGHCRYSDEMCLYAHRHFVPPMVQRAPMRFHQLGKFRICDLCRRGESSG